MFSEQLKQMRPEITGNNVLPPYRPRTMLHQILSCADVHYPRSTHIECRSFQLPAFCRALNAPILCSANTHARAHFRNMFAQSSHHKVHGTFFVSGFFVCVCSELSHALTICKIRRSEFMLPESGTHSAGNQLRTHVRYVYENQRQKGQCMHVR